jgi:sec-independent protein translocase protein TatA
MFDPSAPHIIILLIVVVLLFGAARLPKAAESIGKSMKIFKREVSGLHDDKDTTTEATLQQTALPVQPQQQPRPIDAQPAQNQQLADLQRQINELQKQNAAEGDGATVGQQQPF